LGAMAHMACETVLQAGSIMYKKWCGGHQVKQQMKDRSATRMAADLLISVCCVLWTQFEGLDT
jgi:hypothetical protein